MVVGAYIQGFLTNEALRSIASVTLANISEFEVRGPGPRAQDVHTPSHSRHAAAARVP